MKTRKILLLAVLLYSSASIYSQTIGTRKWDYITGGSINSSPAIGGDGTIYIGSDDMKLHAIKPDGSVKWEFLTGGIIYSSPSIGIDGTIYVGSNDRKLYAINSDGTKKWEYLTGNYVNSSPTIGFDGTVYIGSLDNKVYALNTNGTKKWQYITGSSINSSPALDPNGTIYVGSNDKKLYAINADGTKKWEYLTGGSITCSAAIGDDGTIFVAAEDSKLYAINPDGTKKWEYSTGNWMNTSPVIDSEGTIYVGTFVYLHAINPDGTKKWSYNVSDFVKSSAAVGSDGIIYVGSDNKKLFAINPDGTKKWEYLTGNLLRSSPAIASDGTIYIGSYDNRLYAINSSSLGLMNSSWPKYKHDNFNRGQIYGLGVSNIDFTNFVLPNQSFSFKINFISTFKNNISIASLQLNDIDFGVSTSLPVTIAPGVKQEVSLALKAPKNKWYKPELSVGFTYEGTSLTRKYTLEGLVFLDEPTELAHTAKQAISVWNAMDRSNEIIYYNTKGVLYRLLAEYKMAEYCFNLALSKAINARYSYTGIMMNMGVVKSDRLVSDSAAIYYDKAMTGIQTTATTSVLAPQIYYNQAWEAFGKSDYAQATTLALSTINHSKSNDYLKAKAYTLLGAIRFSEEKYNEAKVAFNQAISLDSNGPVGEMARENLALTNSVGIEDDSGNTDIRVYPNPSAGEIFITAGSLNGNCSISIFNTSGEKVYASQLNASGLSPLSLDISFLVDGVYYIQVISREIVFVEKIVLKKE